MFTPAISLTTTIPALTNVTATSLPINPKQQNPLHTTLKSLSRSGKLEEALSLIESPPSKPTTSQPDLDTYSSLLHACISQRSLHHGQRLYLHLLLPRNKHLLNNPILKTKLITLYAVCGQIDEARRIFDDGIRENRIPESVWVAMAVGYSRNGCFQEALVLYCDMLWGCVRPGNFAFSAALKACSALLDLRVGQMVHAQILKFEEEPDQVVYNGLVRFYGECGCFDDVRQVFDEMPCRNIVTWNSLIAGFAVRDQSFEVFEAFRRMQGEEVGYSWVTLTSVLPVCARVTALYSGKEIHAQIVKSGEKPDVLVLNSLMDMYTKCGATDYCRKVFYWMRRRDLTTWNTMLRGCAMNGCMAEAMELFSEMVVSGFRPDGVTFIALLSGCSHEGLTDEGRALFDRMRVEFGISPTLEHYACLVDILGRAGAIKEALEVVKNMPMKPGSSIWGSLLNSCRLYGNVSLAEIVSTELFELEPNNPGNYVILSNIYANAGMWAGVKRVRELMIKREIKKEPGCSWMQLKNRIHTFIAGGCFEFRNSDEYKTVWNELMEAMEVVGYVPDTRAVLHDVNEDTKTEWVCGHSERLATMFGLIHTGSGIPIRITKNLRVCTDCHSWMKYVSVVTKRVIILRDTKRFHHFEEGTCSCKDYW